MAINILANNIYIRINNGFSFLQKRNRKAQRPCPVLLRFQGQGHHRQVDRLLHLQGQKSHYGCQCSMQVRIDLIQLPSHGRDAQGTQSPRIRNSGLPLQPVLQPGERVTLRDQEICGRKLSR